MPEVKSDASVQVFRVTAEVDQAIRRHGEETYPHECCGALIGTGGHATATVALPNTTEEGPRRRFMVRPSDYRTAEQRATELGGELLGFYHSHPDHPSRPSQTDTDAAHLGYSYVIISVQNGTVASAQSWVLNETDSEKKFYEEPLVSEQGESK